MTNNCSHNINLNNPFRVFIELRQGNTVDGIRLVFYTDDEQTPMDFTGWTFETDFFDLTVEMPNVLILSKSAEGMEVPIKWYNLDIKGTLNGVVRTIVAGKYEVKKDYLTSGCVQDGSEINLQYFNVIERIVIEGGWLPYFAMPSYQTGHVLQLAGWFGGEGDEPSLYAGWYVGSSGYVENIADATLFGLKGDKGDPFTFDDFTPEQILLLQQPAIDAATIAQTAANNANNAALNANDAADNANASTVLAVGNAYIFSGFINYSNGSLIPNSSYISTDFIPLVKNSDLYIYGYAGLSSCFIAFYDADKNYISGINGDSIPVDKEIIVPKEDIPSNAFFVRGNASITTLNPRISALSLTALLSYFKDLPKTDLTKNLFNKYSIVAGQFVQNPPATGLGNNINYSTSDFIPVNPSTEYSVSGYGSNHYQINIARYTSSKTDISPNVNIQLAGYKFTTPSDCYFIKITVRTGDPADNTDINKIQIEQGNLVTDYENFGIRFINNIPISRESILPPLKPTSGKTWLIIGDSISLAPNSWGRYINQLTDSSTIWNRAVSGSSFKYSASHTVTQVGKDGVTYYVQNSAEQIQCALVDTDIVNPDIVVVSLGTNDGITDLGDYATAMGKATLNDLDKSLLYESIRWDFWTLQMEYPGAMFYAVTPIQRASTETEALEPLYTAIKKMAARYNFIIVDATAESGIVKDFEVDGGNGRYLHDGLHPYNVEPFMGDKLIAKCICSKVLSTYIDVSTLL